MAISIAMLNGPNLNLLGVREPAIYGSTTLAEIEVACRDFAKAIGAGLAFHQSNREADLIDWIQAARESHDAIVINPAGYSFTSVALVDALKLFPGPVIELHISNIHAREAIYQRSRISAVAKAVICGLGAYGYLVALQAAAQLLDGLPAGVSVPGRPGPA